MSVMAAVCSLTKCFISIVMTNRDAMAEPLIELQEVCKSFGTSVILDGIDLTINPGEAVAIISPSGTGKSTIFRVMAGLLAPDAGEVYVQGKPRGLVEEGDDPMGVTLVFQQAALFDSLTVEKNVGFALYRHSKLSPKRIRELVNEKLSMVGLPGIGDRHQSRWKNSGEW